MPSTSGCMFLDRGNELLGGDVLAEVDDLEPGALAHHADQVLADVVQVTLHGAEQQLAGVLDPGFRQERPQ